jgi:hypothetical protein
MRHDELLTKIDNFEPDDELNSVNSMNALRAVVELHKNNGSKYTLGYGQVAIELCEYCRETYPCQTIKVIELNLQ